MRVSVPVYIEEFDRPEGPGRVYTARPLFFPELRARSGNLNRVLATMAGELRSRLRSESTAARHDGLVPLTFSPDVSEHRLKLHLTLRKKTLRFRALLVSFKALGRHIAFVPSLPEVWFDLQRGQTLRDRAYEALTAYLVEMEKAGRLGSVQDQLPSAKDAWVTSLELDFQPRTASPRQSTDDDSPPLAGRFSDQPLDGAEELDRVGACLDWLYPDELERAVFRDREIKELTRLLAAPDRRPVLLVGPRKAGKTTLIHELVFRRVKKRRRTYAARNNVWALSPQRLISGMSYVGQWEDRLLAILRHAKRADHVLYFDDLVGLYLAGIHSQSNLSVAHVLRPYVERRSVRVLAEITPEALRVLREQDRGMADLFHVIAVRETTEPETRRILISRTRRLEAQHQCRFDLDVIPTAMELTARHVPDSAFPGKAAGFIAQLAAKYGYVDIHRDMVLKEFKAKSGLSLGFLDVTAKLRRDEVLAALKEHVIGQDDPLRALANAICVAKARLNEPGKPLGSFLFLGPTGVGKTQCAKTLAAYLFGSPERLVRFDMNEFITASSVSRLTGTFADPEGLLTSALRRQPFSVVLLDEIEKAHPAAFDLLLQVLGEGRLTDALGRTTDFSNAVVILTSNLGVREADSEFGFGPPLASDQRRKDRFVQAAERFFRPEFVNRLDHIIPFDRLSRTEMRSIADILIHDVFRRDGLLQRQSVLQVDPTAMERIVDHGYHPTLGARALRRALERHLTRPVAECLAALQRERPTIIQVYPERDGIAVHTQPLVQREPGSIQVPPSLKRDPQAVLEAVQAELDRIEEAFRQGATDEPIHPESLTPADHRYFAVREQAHQVTALSRYLANRLAARARASRSPARFRSVRRRSRRRFLSLRRSTPGRNEVLATEHLRQAMKELAGDAQPYGDDVGDRMTELVQELAFLCTIASGAAPSDRAALVLRGIADRSGQYTERLSRLMHDFVRSQFGFSCTPVMPAAPARSGGGAEAGLLLEGPGVGALAAIEEGTHLVLPGDGPLLPIQVSALALEPESDAIAAVAAWFEAVAHWRRELGEGNASIRDDPWKVDSVIRLYDERAGTLDLRSGLLARSWPAVHELRSFVLSQIPLPSSVMV